MMEAELNDAEREKLAEVEFEDACQSIRKARSWPGDLSDAEYAQQVQIRDLLKRMMEVGFQRARARKLIAEGSDTPSHMVRQWTRSIKSEKRQ